MVPNDVFYLNKELKFKDQDVELMQKWSQKLKNAVELNSKVCKFSKI